MSEDQGTGGTPDSGTPHYGPPSYGASPYGASPYGASPYGSGPCQGGAGAVQPPYGAAGMLASAADRDRALDVLKAAYGEGRLGKEEFELRSARVLSARYYGDLAPVLADLPGGSAFGAPGAYPRPGYFAAPRPTDGTAVGSLVCSLCGLFFIPPAAIAAVVLGHVARRRIRLTGRRGDGIAIAGLVIGYIGVGIWVLIILALVIAAAHG